MTSLLVSSVALLLSILASISTAVQDANAPWGEKVPYRFRNYFLEPGNVLEDIEEFSSLYIKSVGCMWSEYGYDAYDDDGENRDGDENWYQGRTTAFRANTAYSLYGVKKGLSSFFTLRKCSEHTYINTFITNNGADSILNVTGRLSADDDFYSGYGRAYCYEADQDDDNGRFLGSGDNDDDNSNSRSTTMGCSLNGYHYAMAVFQGDSCDGKYFLNTTDKMRSYNRQQNRVKCDKIWDYGSAFKKGVRVDTPADWLLGESSSCSNAMYDGRCPDPYGVNKAYKRAISRSAPPLQTTSRILSWMALVIGLVLIAIAYYARNHKSIKRHGFVRHAWRSMFGSSRSRKSEQKDTSTVESSTVESSYELHGEEEEVEYKYEEKKKRSRRFSKKRSMSSKASRSSKSRSSRKLHVESGEMA